MQIPYWQQRQKIKLGIKPTDQEAKADKAAKGVYFANQILTAPKCCENCGADLAGTKAINPAAIVAHILPKNKKSGCPSVALHPMNKVYLCGDCHTNMDTKGAAFVKKMKVFPLMVQRVAAFYSEIALPELRRVPEYFRPKKDQ
jgi:hypothetical protein